MRGFDVIVRYRIDDEESEHFLKSQYKSLGTYSTYEKAREVFEEFIYHKMSLYKKREDFKIGDSDTIFLEDRFTKERFAVCYGLDYEDVWHFNNTQSDEDYEVAIIKTEYNF